MEKLLCQDPECPGGNKLSPTILHRGSGDSQEIGLPQRTPVTHPIIQNIKPSSIKQIYLCKEKMSEAVSPGQLVPVASDPVQEEEHVARAGYTVTDAGALPQQSPLPAEVSCPPEDDRYNY